MEIERAECKQFLGANLYSSTALAPEKENAERIVSRLFAYWMAFPQQLPQNYQEQAEQEPPPAWFATTSPA